ncbi:MAG: UDP-N-acetylmuramate--L-alanine ligase, partial [Chlamydiia bacterium]|nr:UDP-N-acetylmuramate--L-alanine ligase [Chlamydiia bacterium]
MTVATRELYHLIGVGGIGMSAIAHILLERGEQVSGSDAHANARTDALQSKGAIIYEGHAAEHLPEGATVIVSTAIREDNPELAAAKARGCHILHRSDMLRELMRGKRVLAVTGTHGKTSTTALLSHVLKEAGMDPSYCVGGEVESLGAHGHIGSGDYFVLEADESDGSFLKCEPFGAIITNIDDDHEDFFGSFTEQERQFAEFARSVQCRDALFVCGSCERTGDWLGDHVSYGVRGEGEIELLLYRVVGWRSEFIVSWNGRIYKD